MSSWWAVSPAARSRCRPGRTDELGVMNGLSPGISKSVPAGAAGRAPGTGTAQRGLVLRHAGTFRQEPATEAGAWRPRPRPAAPVRRKVAASGCGGARGPAGPAAARAGAATAAPSLPGRWSLAAQGAAGRGRRRRGAPVVAEPPLEPASPRARSPGPGRRRLAMPVPARAPGSRARPAGEGSGQRRQYVRSVESGLSVPRASRSAPKIASPIMP